MILHLSSSASAQVLLCVLRWMVLDPKGQDHNYASLVNALLRRGLAATDDGAALLQTIATRLETHGKARELEELLPIFLANAQLLPADVVRKLLRTAIRFDLLDEAARLVDAAPKGSEHSGGEYATVALARMTSPLGRDIRLALELFGLELRHSGPVGEWIFLYIQALAIAGRAEEASALAKRAYAADKNLKDALGFAGWGAFLRSHDPNMLSSFLEEDRRLGRFALRGKIFLANSLAAAGRWQDSVRIATRLYESGAWTTELYACMGWVLAQTGDFEQGLALARVDAQRGTLGPHWRYAFPVFLALAGRRDDAHQALSGLCTHAEKEKPIVLGFPACPAVVLSLPQYQDILSWNPQTIFELLFPEPNNEH